MDIEVVPPDVNHSQAEFTVSNGKIHFGLAAIKGCGAGAADAIATERRSEGKFRSLFDFCERVDPGIVNRATTETLIKAGAFDSLGARRSQLFQVIDRAVQSGAAAAADRRRGQLGLFDNDPDAQETPTASLPDVPPWNEREKLAREKEVLGFYLSSHPLAEHHKTLSTYCSHSTGEAAGLTQRSEVMLGGMLSAVKLSHTKNSRPGNPTRYAMFDLEDMAGTIRCILWPDLFVRYGHLVQPDAILFVRGTIDKRPGSDEANLIVNELITPDELSSRYTRGVMVRVCEQQHGSRGLEQLHEILRGYPGNCELRLLICLADGTRVPCNCGDFRVAINDEMRERVDQLLGPGNFRLLTAARGAGSQRANSRNRG